MSVSEFSMQEQLEKRVFTYSLITVSYQSRYSVPLKALLSSSLSLSNWKPLIYAKAIQEMRWLSSCTSYPTLTDTIPDSDLFRKP